MHLSARAHHKSLLREMRILLQRSNDLDDESKNGDLGQIVMALKPLLNEILEQNVAVPPITPALLLGQLLHQIDYVKQLHHH